MSDKKKISAKVRDEAATICAACASEPVFVGVHHARDAIGASQEAGLLACDAWDFVDRSLGFTYSPLAPLAYAEAEALLRTGWTP